MSTPKEDGGPAHPLPRITRQAEGEVAQWETAGMSLRDYFAAKALQGMGASAYWSEYFTSQDSTMREAAASVAYQMADAMIEARKK